MTIGLVKHSLTLNCEPCSYGGLELLSSYVDADNRMSSSDRHVVLYLLLLSEAVRYLRP